MISNPKLFADDTSLFSVVQNMNLTTTDLNSDLSKISDDECQVGHLMTSQFVKENTILGTEISILGH